MLNKLYGILEEIGNEDLYGKFNEYASQEVDSAEMKSVIQEYLDKELVSYCIRYNLNGKERSDFINTMYSLLSKGKCIDSYFPVYNKDTVNILGLIVVYRNV